MTKETGNAIITTHKLDFEVAPFKPFGIEMEANMKRFRVGTIDGLYSITSESINIIAITNSVKGNGHLNDVFEWFEFSCTNSKMNLMVLEIWNKKFMKHLIKKRGFRQSNKLNVIKYFNPRSNNKIKMNKERRKYLQIALNKLIDAKEIIENMNQEEDESFSNLPEGLQQAHNGQEMETAMNEMDEAVNSIDDAINNLEAIIN